MNSFFRRSLRLSSVFALTLALGACAMPANNGFSPNRSDPMPYAQANARCWEDAYGAPSGGGSSQYGSAMARYDTCMGRAGWQRGKSMF
jgi:hypothetical protein